jgi:hypothetical protein
MSFFGSSTAKWTRFCVVFTFFVSFVFDYDLISLPRCLLFDPSLTGPHAVFGRNIRFLLQAVLLQKLQHERVVRQPRNFESRLLSRASESAMTSIKAPSPAPLGLASVSCFGQESRCSSCSSGCDAEGSFPVKKGNQ